MIDIFTTFVHAMMAETRHVIDTPRLWEGALWMVGISAVVFVLLVWNCHRCWGK